ncbi:MAG: carboxypeptidase-like regulatory domain-containing protein, partial [Cyclobacteriaceae bacterium]|nr:carboxypeptidase-like regulatory domain-containing protein [Cyclobacteriaceae bacterium]
MKKLLPLIFIVFNLISTKSIGQDSDFIISGKYENTPFNIFTKDIERQIPVEFMYYSQIVDSFFVSAIFNNETIKSVLTRVFQGTQIYFFLNENKQIILTQGYEIRADLPFNFFDRSDEDQSVTDVQVIDFLQKEEKKVKLQNTLENTVTEIGNKSGIIDGEYTNLAGYIRDSDTGEPLIGTLIYIENPRIGVVTDQFGYYSLTIPKGKHELLLKYIGYKDTKRQIILYSEGKLDIDMIEDVIPLKEVIIESEKDINIAGMQMGFDKLDAQSMKKVPPVLG